MEAVTGAPVVSGEVALVSLVDTGALSVEEDEVVALISPTGVVLVEVGVDSTAGTGSTTTGANSIVGVDADSVVVVVSVVGVVLVVVEDGVVSLTMTELLFRMTG